MSQFDLPVAHFMTSPVHTLSAAARLLAAARRMDELDVSALPIVDGGRLLGVLDRADLVHHGRLRRRPIAGESRWWWPDLSVLECMQTSVPVSVPEQSLRQCARRMHERGLHRIYVVVDHDLAGVISTREMLSAVAAEQLGSAVQDLELPVADTLNLVAPLALASERFCANAAGVPLVVTDGSRPVGVFSRTELRACLEADAELSTALFMDDRVVVLPAEASLENVAREAFAQRARYVIATDAAGRHRVLSGLEFAGIVSGRPPSEAEVKAPVPAVSVSGPGFRAAEFEEQGGPFVPAPSVPDENARPLEQPVSRESRRGDPNARNEPK